MSLDSKEKELFMQLLDSIELIPKRNEICYCGSGKKYKKCCEEKDRRPITNPIHLEFEITDDPFVLLDLGEALTLEDEDKLFEYLDLLEDETPQAKDQLITGLKALAERYHNPFVWENLRAAYESTGNLEQEKAIQKEMESRFPDCLYSRFERAAQVLDEKRFEAFEECFNHCPNLPQLYPDREVFHISEVVLFHLQWLGYYVATSNLRLAEGHFLILEEVSDDDDPYFLQAQKLIEVLYLQRKAIIFSHRLTFPMSLHEEK